MKYAHYDEATGKLLGWYDSEIHCDIIEEEIDENGNVITPYYIDTSNLPIPFLEVNENDWQISIDNVYNYVDVDTNTLSFKDFRTDDEIFTQTKSSKTNEITNSFNNAVEAITTALPHEMVSWRKQEDEARAYSADNTVETPFIDAQLVTRDLGETKDELIAKVIANADAYQVAYATLLGKFQNLTNKISIATTVDELNLIVW